MWTALDGVYKDWLLPLRGARLAELRANSESELRRMFLGTCLPVDLLGHADSFAAADAHRFMLWGPSPATRWSFYVGMTRERFDELKAAGELPITIGSYDETMAEVAKCEAAREQEIYGKSIVKIYVDDL